MVTPFAKDAHRFCERCFHVELAWIAAGMGTSFLLARLVKSMLYGIAPYDPVTLFGAAALLLTVTLGASAIPARRAAGVQPAEALRHE
jgi:ABC-type lipoprotein release transport system permease subunit